MKQLTIETVAKACGGEIVATPEQIAALRGAEVRGVVTDNRKVKPGYVFIPIVGARVDGHTFIPQALADGALFTLSQRRLAEPDGAYVLVEDSEKALCDIAAYYRSTLTIPIVGVTGSVGKTGTKEMIAAVLSQRYRTQKTQGNFNNEIGLPLTLLTIDDEDEVAVVEMGISDFGEMHRLGRMAQPDIMVITNIGQCHLQQLHDRDGVFAAKTEVFAHLRPDAAVVLNTDDDKLAAVTEVPGARVVRFGTEAQPIHAADVTVRGLEGVDATLVIDGESVPIHIPIPGEHNIYHALAAAAVGRLLGLTPQQIADGIGQAAAIAGRTNFLHLEQNVTVIDDCYNASPASVKAALTLLSRMDGRRIAVLGDMGELGADERKLHREVGAHLAALPIDVLYTAGTLTKELAAEVARVQSGAESAGDEPAGASPTETAETMHAQSEAENTGGELADVSAAETAETVRVQSKAGNTDGEPADAPTARAGGNPRCMIHTYDTRDELIDALLADVRTGDTILVKASHFMAFPAVVDALREHGGTEAAQR